MRLLLSMAGWSVMAMACWAVAHDIFLTNLAARCTDDAWRRRLLAARFLERLR